MTVMAAITRPDLLILWISTIYLIEHENYILWVWRKLTSFISLWCWQTAILSFSVAFWWDEAFALTEQHWWSLFMPWMGGTQSWQQSVGLDSYLPFNSGDICHTLLVNLLFLLLTIDDCVQLLNQASCMQLVCLLRHTRINLCRASKGFMMLFAIKKQNKTMPS